MSITHTITKTWKGQTGTTLTQSVTCTGTEELNLDFTLNASTTNQQESLAFTKALLQSIYINSDQAITIKTNSSSVPQDTITLVANDPYQWDVNCGITNPFGGSVTTAYFTNAGSANANVKVRCLTNG